MNNKVVMLKVNFLINISGIISKAIINIHWNESNVCDLILFHLSLVNCNVHTFVNQRDPEG